jgi:hypothetical protein
LVELGTDVTASRRLALEEAIPNIAKRALVPAVKAVEEELTYAFSVRPAGCAELLEPGIRQLGEGSAPILVRGAPGDVPLRDEAIYEPRQPAAAQEDSVSDLCHPKPAVIGVGKEHQNLVRRDGKPML